MPMITNDLKFPTSEELFEEMCFHLYKAEWGDPGANRLGGPGQGQWGLDIVGVAFGRDIGVQCKHYVKTPFSLATVERDLAKLDSADAINVSHVIFATTAQNKAALVAEVNQLSRARRDQGKSAVTVHFWSEISAMLRKFPAIAREYIPEFPGGTLKTIDARTESLVCLLTQESSLNEPMRQQIGEMSTLLAGVSEMLAKIPAQGANESALVAKQLNLAAEKLQAGRTEDASAALEILGDPSGLNEASSKFRWHTIQATIFHICGKPNEAACSYLKAFTFKPEAETAQRNKVIAYLLLTELGNAADALRAALERFPESAQLWALHVSVSRELGRQDPEVDIPEGLAGSLEILYAMSHLRHCQDRPREALEFIERCLSLGPPTLEIRRTYLARALAWALEDAAMADLGQITEVQRASLQSAVASFEPLDEGLLAIQSDKVFEEVANNLLIALRSLGRLEEARRLARIGLSRRPLMESFLRTRIEELGEKADLAGLKAFAQDRLSDLPTNALAELAEISSNLGVVDIFAIAAAEMRKRELPLRAQQDLDVLGIHLLWRTRQFEQALVKARAHVVTHPLHVIGHIELVRVLASLDMYAEALLALPEIDALVRPQRATTLEVLQLADLLRDLGMHHRAVEFYGRVMVTPGTDPVTYRYLHSLIESDHRLRAQQVMNELPQAVRERPAFRRLEIKLARRKGDWGRVAELLRPELCLNPTNASIAASFANALHRLGDASGELKDYLAKDNIFDGKYVLDEVEYSKCEAAYGLVIQAVRRLYRLFRANRGDTRVAGFFLARLRMSAHQAGLQRPVTAGKGSAALLRRDGAADLIVAIDIDSTEQATWPELVSPDSDVAIALEGLEPGQQVLLPRGLETIEYELIELVPLYEFAAKHASDLLEVAPANHGPAWVVPVDAQSGHVNLEFFWKHAQEIETQVQAVFADYAQSPVPLAKLAQRVHKSPLELVLAWPVERGRLIVALGTDEEWDAQEEVLQSAQPTRFVLDLPTIGELVVLGLMRDVGPLLGRPLVPSIARDEVVGLIEQELRENPLLAETMSLTMQDVSGEDFDLNLKRFVLMKSVLACIDELCEVTPVLGPAERGPGHRLLEELLDDATLDSVYLALERGAVLLVDDAHLRLQVAEIGLHSTVGTQVLLSHARTLGIINDKRYVDALGSKLARGHSFLRLSAHDLWVAAHAKSDSISDTVIAGLGTLREACVDIASGAQFLSDFLVRSAMTLRPEVYAAYVVASVDAFSAGQPEQADSIYRGVAKAVRKILDELPSQRGVQLEEALQAFFKDVPAQGFGRRLTATAMAAKVLTSR